jgi:hypothetical protein
MDLDCAIRYVGLLCRQERLMRKSLMTALVVSVGVAACADHAPQPGESANVIIPSETPPAPGGASGVLLFEGSYDASAHELTITFRSPSGSVQSMATLPYGTGVDQIDFHTIPGSVQWQGGCGTSTLCANVQARNHYTTKTVTGLQAIFDAIAPASVTATGAPYVYGTVAALGASTNLVWSFNDPTNANFQFVGHADGTIAAQTGNATLASSPASISLGSMPIGTTGANGSNTGAAASVNVTVTDTSATDSTGSLTVTRTAGGSPEIIVGSGDCTGKTLQPSGTCVNGYILDCRTASGATVGAKTATFTVTDPVSTNVANSTSFTVTGNCIAATTGGGLLSVTPRTKAYGNVELQASLSQGFVFRNVGTTATGALTGPVQTGATEFKAAPGCTGVSLAVGQTCSITYSLDCSTVTGATLGSKTGTATVTDPASTSTSANTATISLSGACVCVAAGNGCNTTTDCCAGTCNASFVCQ